MEGMTDRELASKMQEEEDRKFAMNFAGNERFNGNFFVLFRLVSLFFFSLSLIFVRPTREKQKRRRLFFVLFTHARSYHTTAMGSMGSVRHGDDEKESIKRNLLHKNFYNRFGDDNDEEDADLVIPPPKIALYHQQRKK